MDKTTNKRLYREKALPINHSQKTKVLFFETPVENQNKTWGKSDERNLFAFPIGILYLDSVLKTKGYEVLTKDYSVWDETKALLTIKKVIKEFKPDFVGITVMTMTRASTYRAIKLIKKINPKIKIILGGIHASVMYKQLLENFPIDGICIGEAEDSLPELLDAILNKKNLNNVKGIAYKEGNKVVLTEQRPLRTDLDSLPYPNHDAFMKPEIKEVEIVSSRGCPNKCQFCCLHLVSRRIWRPRKAKNVADEIEYIVKKYPWVESIKFLDDTFTLDNQRVIEICKEIIKRKIKIKLHGQSRVKPFSKEMVYWMEKAGFARIYFGVETGSEKIMKTMRKGITKKDVIDTFKIFREFPKIKIEKFIIVGLPGETEETVNETIDFIRQLQKVMVHKMEFFYVAPLWVFPGTEVYDITVKNGYINDDYWLSSKPVPFFTVEHCEKWLVKNSTKMMLATILAGGKINFLKVMLNRLLTHPMHYIKRFLRLNQNKELKKS